jgi:hypothetical protein
MTSDLRQRRCQWGVGDEEQTCHVPANYAK